LLIFQEVITIINSFYLILILLIVSIVTSRPQDFDFLFFFEKEEIWDRKGVEGRFRILSRRSTRYGVSRESNTLVLSPRCGSAYHVVAMTPSGTVRSSVL